nr:hypothetical protein [Tanacetum cinerariifolium]
KTRSKGSQGKKANVFAKPASVEESDESDSEPARQQTSSRRVIKKKVSISANDNIILELDVALELEKSTILIEATEEEVARQVHATQERIMTESGPDLARRRPSGIAFGDISSMSKKLSIDPSQKLKSVQTLTPEEQLVADTMQELKAISKATRNQIHVRGSSQGTGSKLRVPDESIVTHTTSSEGTGNDEDIPWESTNKDEEKKDDDDADDDKSIDLEKTGDEEIDDEFDEEMTDAEDAETGEDNKGITEAKNTEVTKGGLEQAGKPPLTSSSLSVSSGFGIGERTEDSGITEIGTMIIDGDWICGAFC